MKTTYYFRVFPFCLFLILLVSFAPAAIGEEANKSGDAGSISSGLPVGEYVLPFDMIKCSGGENDGFKIGAEVCYVCEYESRPVVLVFARHPVKGLKDLIEALDKQAAAHADKKLGAAVALLGDDKKELLEAGKKLGATRVPVAVPLEDAANGPEDYHVHPQAKATILVYRDAQVKAVRTFTEKLDKQAIHLVLGDVKKMLAKSKE